MIIQAAPPVEQPHARTATISRMMPCACGRMAPDPGVAPIGAFIAHCYKYHPHPTHNRFCVKCGLCRVQTDGETCVACVTSLLRLESHRELQAKPVVTRND